MQHACIPRAITNKDVLCQAKSGMGKTAVFVISTLQMLKDDPNISEVFLCMDSDKPGQAAAKRISDKLFTQGINARILVPEHKDWNEDLLYLNQEENEVKEPCQVLRL